MKLTGIVMAVGLTVLSAAASVAPAGAFDFDPSRAPERAEIITHRIYRPHYVHVYKHGDPYKYRYARVGYYPNSGSHYWVPSEQMRYRYRYHYSGPKYQYHPSWGYGHGSSHRHDACQHGCRTK